MHGGETEGKQRMSARGAGGGRTERERERENVRRSEGGKERSRVKFIGGRR